jgi:hypothetical protein
MNFKEPQGQLARWLEVLSQYHMHIQHRAGKKHGNADGLSRLRTEKPCKKTSTFIPPESLPCGGCKYCVNVHEKWQDFVKVDSVIPLAAAPTTKTNHEVCEIRDVIFHKQFPSPPQKSHSEKMVEVHTIGVDSCGIQYTTEELLTEQRKDPDLQLILEWLTSQKEPDEADLFLSSQAAKKYLINKEQFFLDDEIILRNRSKNNVIRLVVPKSYTQEVMTLNHDIPMTGNQGVDRTRARVKGKYYWYKMNETIKTMPNEGCKKSAVSNVPVACRCPV